MATYTPSPYRHGDAHRVNESVGKHLDTVGFAVVVLIREDQEPVALVAFVIGRPKVRVALDGPNAALVIDVDIGRRDDLRQRPQRG